MVWWVSRWRPFTVYKGLRIYELDHPAEASSSKARPPCRRIQVTVRATPLETFISLVRIPCSTPHGIIESMHIVERIGTTQHHTTASQQHH